MQSEDSNRYMLRHALATLSYRGGKTLRGASDSFGDYHVSQDGRTPIEILAHMGDLLDWALSLAAGNETWHNVKPQSWTDESARFFATLKALDTYLASDNELHVSCERLFQGPIADALTHTGQLAMLRRLSGNNMMGENYSKAVIKVGHVGTEQEPPPREFK